MWNIMPFGIEEDQRRADNGDRVVHDEGREKAHHDEDMDDEGVGALSPLEYAVGKMMKVPALYQGFADHEHAKEKDHYVQVDCLDRRARSEGPKEKDRNPSSEHYRPDGEPEPSYLPDCDEDKDYQKDYRGNGVYGRHKIKGTPLRACPHYQHTPPAGL